MKLSWSSDNFPFLFSTHSSLSLFHLQPLSFLPSLRLAELWQLPRCPATVDVCSRGSLSLATQTCHHCSASNRKLPINSWATPTCLKAPWPAPLQFAPFHMALTPTASQPCSMLSKYAPWDTPWLHDIQMLRDILPHLYLSVCLSVRPLNFTKEDKVSLSAYSGARQSPLRL